MGRRRASLEQVSAAESESLVASQGGSGALSSADQGKAGGVVDAETASSRRMKLAKANARNRGEERGGAAHAAIAKSKSRAVAMSCDQDDDEDDDIFDRSQIKQRAAQVSAREKRKKG